ncbi:hypothetical protein C8A01DRAFT_15249, partial [Parachaetomium inaequale]
TKLGFLYEELVQDCSTLLEEQYQQAKAEMEEQAKKEQAAKMDWVPIPVPPPQTREKRVEQRRQKEKTRLAHSSVYDITLAAERPAEEPVTSAQVFKVSSSTADVFSTLFDKSQSRGADTWVDFGGAMADTGFSVMPRFGSVYTLLPSDSIAVKKSFPVHRPHKSRIEGYVTIVLARRLSRVYEWGASTFVVA